MFKMNKIVTARKLFPAVLAVLIMSGCRTASIPVAVPVPGEFNLIGVSKIALVDFNSMPEDSVAGVYSADKETVSIVQRMVSSTFYKNKMYQVANLDIEKEIAAKHSVRIANKFDAVLYGRLWWQISPECRSTYPEVFTLESWRNVQYDTGAKDFKGNPIYATAHVTTKKEDVLKTLCYRAWNANLMLSLILYRLDKDGKVDKVTETFAVASQNFLLDNGSFTTQYAPIGSNNDTHASRLKASTENKSFLGSLFSKEQKGKDVTNKFVVVQQSATIPPELQAKLMLAGKLTSGLGKKLAPSEIIFNIPCNFDDDKLFNLLKNGAFSAAKEYIVFKVRKDFGNGIADKIDPIAFYDIPKNLNVNVKADETEITDKNAQKAAIAEKDYLYALAVCEEATGAYEQALSTYRYAFNLMPEKEFALGISRCLFAMGKNDRIQEKVDAKKSASKKAYVN